MPNVTTTPPRNPARNEPRGLERLSAKPPVGRLEPPCRAAKCPACLDPREPRPGRLPGPRTTKPPPPVTTARANRCARHRPCAHYKSDTDDGCHVWMLIESTTIPTSMANAGLRLINVPKAAVVNRRSASNSRLNGTIGNRMATPRSGQKFGQLRQHAAPKAMVVTKAATGIETPRPPRPSTLSPTFCVQQDVGCPATGGRDRRSDAHHVDDTCHGRVNNSTRRRQAQARRTVSARGPLGHGNTQRPGNFPQRLPCQVGCGRWRP